MPHDGDVAAAAAGTPYEPPPGWSIDEDTVLFRRLGEWEVPGAVDGVRTWFEGDRVLTVSRELAEAYDRSTTPEAS